MKLGLVIPRQMIDHIEAHVRSEFPDLEILRFPYDMIPDIPGVIEGKQNHADAFLFLGETARRWAARQTKPVVPWATIPRSSASLLRLLVRAVREGYQMRIATDFPQETFFRRAFEEAGYHPKDAAFITASSLPYMPDFPEKDAAQLEAFYRDKKADFCITAFYQVYLILRKKNIPIYMLQPAYEDIRHAVQELIISCRLEESQRSQIASLAFHIDPKPSAEDMNDYDLSLEQLQATRCIYEFAHSIQAACTEVSPREYLLFSTREPVEQETNRFQTLRIIQTVQDRTNLILSAGIGYGRTADAAKSCARKAMNRALAGGGNRAFFLGETGNFIGPIANIPLISPKGFDEKLVSLSQISGVSLRYLKLFQNLCHAQGRSRFTPAELADATGIGLRTVNRILLKLMDCGCCKEAGRHFASKSGRPSRIIELYLEE